jgi:hypothetical protein
VKYQTLPEISFITIYNQEQNAVDLPKYKGYVIQFFNSGCEICQGEAQDYFKHRDSLQEYLFVMLSTDSISKVKEFAMKQQLSQSDNFIFGHVDPAVMWAGFGDVSVPCLFFYNSERSYITKTRITDSSMILGYFNKSTQ